MLLVLPPFCEPASSRQNDSDRIFPGLVRLEKRSIEMKPSIFSSSAAARGDIEIFLLALAGFKKNYSNMNLTESIELSDVPPTPEYSSHTAS